MTKNEAKESRIFILLIFLISIPFLLLIIPKILNPPHNPGIEVAVQWKLKNCFTAIIEYSDKNKKYPSAENWQNILLPYLDNKKDAFKLPTKVNTINTIAINPIADINSSNDVVVLFESTGGWNAYGQSELLAPTSNGKPGCFVLFNDGYIKFISPEKIENLNWGN